MGVAPAEFGDRAREREGVEGVVFRRRAVVGHGRQRETQNEKRSPKAEFRVSRFPFLVSSYDLGAAILTLLKAAASFGTSVCPAGYLLTLKR